MLDAKVCLHSTDTGHIVGSIRMLFIVYVILLLSTDYK